MIVSKSQSQATLPEELSGPLASCAKLAIASFIIHYPEPETRARELIQVGLSQNGTLALDSKH
jgi:hypothetical protein